MAAALGPMMVVPRKRRRSDVQSSSNPSSVGVYAAECIRAKRKNKVMSPKIMLLRSRNGMYF